MAAGLQEQSTMDRNISREESDKIIKKTNESLLHRLVLKGGQQVMALVFGIVLARLLSPAEFGVVAVANLVIRYANNFTNFGLNNALVQNDNVGRTHINTVFTIDLAISTSLLVATVMAADRIATFFHNPDVGPVLKWMALYYVITTFYHIPVVILRRNIDFRFLSVVEFTEGVLTSGVAIMLAWFGFSYWSIVIPSLAVPVLVAVIFIIHTQWRPGIVLGKNMGELYSFGWWNFIRTQVQLVVSKVDYFVIGRYLGPQYLGLYEKSFELTERAMTGFTMPVNSIFFSTFSRLKGDPARVKQVFLDASGLLALICYPVLFGLVGIAPNFVMSCLGYQWQDTIIPLQILAAASLFRVLLGLVASANVAVGKYKIHTLVNILLAVLFVCLCFAVVQFGIVAVSSAYFIFCVICFLASSYVLWSSIKVNVTDMLSCIWIPLIGSIVMLFVLIFLRDNIFSDITSFSHMLFIVSICGSVYFLWCYPFVRSGAISFSITGADRDVKS